jgi:hypothetical protein
MLSLSLYLLIPRGQCQEAQYLQISTTSDVENRQSLTLQKYSKILDLAGILLSGIDFSSKQNTINQLIQFHPNQ